jgi:hypothetical protein
MEDMKELRRQNVNWDREPGTDALYETDRPGKTSGSAISNFAAVTFGVDGGG